MATVFFSYSHTDEAMRTSWKNNLAMLKREGAITTWHDRRIAAGDPVDRSISRYLEVADVVLLLVTADFLSSEYCYGIEMQRAMERQERREDYSNSYYIEAMRLAQCTIWWTVGFANRWQADNDVDQHG